MNHYTIKIKTADRYTLDGIPIAKESMEAVRKLILTTILSGTPISTPQKDWIIRGPMFVWQGKRDDQLTNTELKDKEVWLQTRDALIVVGQSYEVQTDGEFSKVNCGPPCAGAWPDKNCKNCGGTGLLYIFHPSTMKEKDPKPQWLLPTEEEARAEINKLTGVPSRFEDQPVEGEKDKLSDLKKKAWIRNVMKIEGKSEEEATKAYTKIFEPSPEEQESQEKLWYEVEKIYFEGDDVRTEIIPKWMKEFTITRKQP